MAMKLGGLIDGWMDCLRTTLTSYDLEMTPSFPSSRHLGKDLSEMLENRQIWLKNSQNR